MRCSEALARGQSHRVTVAIAAVGGASEFLATPAPRQPHSTPPGSGCFVITVTPGSHPGLLIFCPSGAGRWRIQIETYHSDEANHALLLLGKALANAK
jgi:hypothetical protein